MCVCYPLLKEMRYINNLAADWQHDLRKCVIVVIIQCHSNEMHLRFRKMFMDVLKNRPYACLLKWNGNQVDTVLANATLVNVCVSVQHRLICNCCYERNKSLFKYLWAAQSSCIHPMNIFLSISHCIWNVRTSIAITLQQSDAVQQRELV